MASRLYYGDNLDILRSQIKDENIDLIETQKSRKNCLRYVT